MEISTIGWLITALCFLLFEMGNPGLFFFLSFFFGALSAFLISLCHIDMQPQYVAFFVASIVSFVILKLWVKRTRRQAKNTNASALIGKQGLVIKEISATEPGLVKIGGEIWSAKSKNNEAIPIDSWVEITHVRGAHVIVIKNSTAEGNL